MGAHAKFSASGSKRWLTCPGSIQLAEGLPPAPDSSYAKEGTKAHEALEAFLKGGQGKQLATHAALRAKGFTMQMLTHAEAAARWIWDATPKGAELKAETRVSLEFVHEDMFGTADAIIIDPFGDLKVLDFKYGAGVPVDAEGNTQGAYYALGVAHPYDYNFQEITIGILQPRAFHQKGPNRTWTLSPRELRGYADVFKRGVERALGRNPPLVPGPHCRWCPAERICPKVGNRRGSGAAAADFS